jgi:hypothetical protein
LWFPWPPKLVHRLFIYVYNAGYVAFFVYILFSFISATSYSNQFYFFWLQENILYKYISYYRKVYTSNHSTKIKIKYTLKVFEAEKRKHLCAQKRKIAEEEKWQNKIKLRIPKMKKKKQIKT